MPSQDETPEGLARRYARRLRADDCEMCGLHKDNAAHKGGEVTHLWPPKHNYVPRPSDTPAPGSEARPGVGGVVESHTADEEGLASRVEELESALGDAVELIRIWHGELGWEVYRTHAPEMLRLNQAIAKHPGSLNSADSASNGRGE